MAGTNPSGCAGSHRPCPTRGRSSPSITFSPNKKSNIVRKKIKKMMMKMNLKCGYKTITSCWAMALSNKNGPLAGRPF